MPSGKIRLDLVKTALARALQIGEVPHELCLSCEACEGIRHALETGHYTARLNQREVSEVVRRAKHAKAIREQVERMKTEQAKPMDYVPCNKKGCTKEVKAKGMCTAHYQAERRAMLAKLATTGAV